MSGAISVLVVEDHALLRKCLRRALEDDPDLTVAGEAANGAEAVELAQELAPRVVVMDVEMPVMDGIQAVRRILSSAPETAVLMISISAEESSVRSAFEAGARGFLLKNAAGFDLGGAVKAVAAGRRVLVLGSGFPAQQPVEA
jgi:DNA-binding NarL/FixJ family response regulator